MNHDRPFSQACENNKAPILSILKSAFAPCKHVLEIGSGTGQHAQHFAKNLGHLVWQPSDRLAYHPGIRVWLQDYTGSNLRDVCELDVQQAIWPNGFDAVFSANTAHIMPWPYTQLMTQRVAELLPIDGVFALYGPFNYKGEFSSESNAQFDLWLKSQAAHQGIRDFEAIDAIAKQGGLRLICDHAMPANNRLLVWKKLSAEYQN